MPHLKNDPQPDIRKLRFGAYEVDPHAGELTKHGVRIPLQPRPFRALVLLLQRGNQLVTRQELQKNLWSSDVFVDFEHGLNTAIRKVRLALNDDAEKPRFIQTVGRQGYRFLMHVEETLIEEVQAAQVQIPAIGEEPVTASEPGQMAQVALDLPGGAVGRRNHQIKIGWLVTASIFFAGLLIAYLLRPRAPLPRVNRATQLTKSGNARILEPLYTDGPRVYYQSTGPLTADPQLRQVLLNGNEDTPAGIPAGLFRIRGLSPDDTEFVALSSGSTVWRIPVAGGSPRRVGDLIANDIAWSHDGNSFAYSWGNELFLTNSGGESPRALAKVADVGNTIDHIRWSPDDRRLRFTLVGPATRSLWEIHPDGSNLHEMHFNWPGNSLECCGDWIANGRYFVFKSNRDGISNIWALQEKSAWSRRSNPDPVELTFGPMSYLQPVPSRNGQSIFAIGVQPSGELVRYDAGRKGFVPFLQGRSIGHLAFSRDGKWLAYVAHPEGTLWRARSDGTEQIQLTFPPLQVSFPRWSANGDRIAFSAIQPGELWKSFVISAEGGNPQPFPSDSLSQASPDWMPNRDALIYSRAYGAENPGLYLFDVRSGRSEKIPGTDGLYEPRWSPDGRYLAAADVTSDALVLVDLKSGKRTQLGGPAFWGVWSPDSQYIYFLRWGVDSILRLHVPDGREEKALEVPFPVASWPFTVAPDGSFVILRDRTRYDVYVLSLSLP